MKPINTVHIIGMGALGMLHGQIIADHIGIENVAFVVDDARYERYRDKPFTVNGRDLPFRVIRAGEAGPCDLLIVAVKFTGLEEALDSMAASVGEDTVIISLLNGISSEEVIAERYGAHRIVHAVAQGMDAMHFDRQVTYTKPGELYLGVVEPALPATLDRLTAFLDRAGVAYTLAPDIIYRQWSKFMINVGINQSCMVYGADYGGVLQPASLEFMTMVSAMREVILIANAEGIPLSEKDLAQYLALIKTFAPDAMPSMGQDRKNRRPSEVELFSGTMLRFAEKHGIPVPTNEYLYRRVREIEAEY